MGEICEAAEIYKVQFQSDTQKRLHLPDPLASQGKNTTMSEMGIPPSRTHPLVFEVEPDARTASERQDWEQVT